MHDECRMREKIHLSKAQDASNIKHIASILKRSSGNFMSIMCHLCINRGSLKRASIERMSQNLYQSQKITELLKS